MSLALSKECKIWGRAVADDLVSFGWIESSSSRCHINPERDSLLSRGLLAGLKVHELHICSFRHFNVPSKQLKSFSSHLLSDDKASYPCVTFVAQHVADFREKYPYELCELCLI